MKEYPMLEDIDEARVNKVGGKLAILERILEKDPSTPIPKILKKYENEAPWISSIDFDKRMFRASSDLDVFGGCGIHETFRGVNTLNFRESAKAILEPEDEEKAGLKLFSQSVGREYKKPTIFSQVQGSPEMWGTLLQHPENPEVILVAYSDSPSLESKDALTGSNRSFYVRDTYTAIYHCQNGNLDGNSREEDKKMLDLAVLTQLVLQDLKIVSSDWASILEFGIYPEKIEVYQLTPIRKISKQRSQISEDKLVIGNSTKAELPVVKIPKWSDVGLYQKLKEKGNLDPHFIDYFENIEMEHGTFSASLLPADMIIWMYMFDVERECPGGYIAIVDMEARQKFDLPVKNARAVLVNTHRPPITSLDHNVSRLIYKSPVLIVDDIEDRLEKKFKTGEKATFSCNGSNYSLI